MAPFEVVEAGFWDAGVKHGVLPALTAEMVAAAERDLGVVLPAELLRLLRIQNGGVVADAWDACPAEANFYADDHVPFDLLFGIGPAGAPGDITLLDTPYLVTEWGLPSGVVLLSGQGHSWTALDYRACGPRGNPAVAWLDNEMDHELRLAADFRSFTEQLTPAATFDDCSTRR